jgi:transposase-like protein
VKRVGNVPKREGPAGRRERLVDEVLTVRTLPPANISRWSVKRKAEVVAAVTNGLLTVEEACERYSLSIEEFTGWQITWERSGMAGLRVSRAQENRVFFRRQS